MTLHAPSTFESLLQHIPIRASIPSEWHSFLVTLLAILPLLLPTLVLIRRIRMQNACATPFRFLDLPPELRDIVYEFLLEDPCYPPKPRSQKASGFGSSFGWNVLGRRSPDSLLGKKSNWIFLANRQIHREFMDVLCKKGKFTLTLSPDNYPKSLRSITSSPYPSTKSSKIWSVAPEVLQQIRKCEIRLITTSSMLGVPDPRNMAPASWPLVRQVRQELKEVKNVSELNLHVRAIGDPLWNPLWVWYHACQSFKHMGSNNPTKKTGPQLSKITFSLDSWSPGENHLERDERGCWIWKCRAEHGVGVDGDADMTVREFCARLYAECKVCRPESEGE